VPQGFPRHFQPTAQRGACGKAPISAHNRRTTRWGPHSNGADDVETVTGRAQIFDLPESLAAKAEPALIGGDREHLAAVGRALEETIDDLAARLDETRLRRAGGGQQALERDQEVHRLTARLRTLRRFGLDLCLGRMVLSEDAPSTDGGRTVYVGRLGLTDRTGRRLLVDW